MGILIDSSVFIAIERQGVPPNAAIALVGAENAAMASITASELLSGVHRANTPERRLRREAFVEAILAAVPVIPFDLLVARTYARICSHLAAVGQPVGAHDLLVAATAFSHGYEVFTQNVRDFRRLPGLGVRQVAW